MKQLEESNAQHTKTIKTLKTQLDKYERLSGTSRNKALDLETELAQMKKVGVSLALPEPPFLPPYLRFKTNIGSRYFSVAASTLWNSAPDNVESANIICNVISSSPETYLF